MPLARRRAAAAGAPRSPDGAPTRRVLALHTGETRTLEYSINCPRWGAFRIASIRLSTRDQLHLRRAELVVEPTTTLRVYPSVERLRRLAGPRATRPVTGSRPAAVAGEGIEFAELRFLAPGERARRINWRATAARGRLLVNDRLPERSSDVVIFLDALGAADERGGHARPRRTRGCLAERGLSPPARPRRAPTLRRRHRVDHPRLGPAPAVSDRGRLARERGRANAPLARHEPHSAPDPPAPVADRRADTAARLARHARSSTSAAAATRSRSSRSIRSVPRRRRGRGRADRLANLVARAGRRPNAARRRGDRARVVGTGRADRAPVEALAAAR